MADDFTESQKEKILKIIKAVSDCKGDGYKNISRRFNNMSRGHNCTFGNIVGSGTNLGTIKAEIQQTGKEKVIMFSFLPYSPYYITEEQFVELKEFFDEVYEILQKNKEELNVQIKKILES